MKMNTVLKDCSQYTQATAQIDSNVLWGAIRASFLANADNPQAAEYLMDKANAVQLTVRVLNPIT